ncbi:MAG: SDR family NAD(P)-dependent oxidoreductase [Kiloniellaceae bacterium]
MTLDFQDKIVLVTGASTGIGAATAKGFAKQGARVAMNYGSSTAEAERVRDEIAAGGGTVQLFQADISDPDAVARLVSDVVAHFGKLDVVVCNAGGLVGRKGLTEITGAFYDDVMDLNIRSVVATCAAAIPHLIETRGNIVVTGSVAAQLGGGAGASLYAASKAAVQNLVKSYAKEFAGQGVRFNAVSPGTIYTLFHQKHTKPEVLETIKASIPMGRLGTPEDCVGAYLFLASDALAGYITGQAVEVNGGQLMP